MKLSQRHWSWWRLLSRAYLQWNFLAPTRRTSVELSPWNCFDRHERQQCHQYRPLLWRSSRQNHHGIYVWFSPYGLDIAQTSPQFVQNSWQRRFSPVTHIILSSGLLIVWSNNVSRLFWFYAAFCLSWDCCLTITQHAHPNLVLIQSRNNGWKFHLPTEVEKVKEDGQHKTHRIQRPVTTGKASL